jgi:phosphopantetheine--protein transferase-like protein
VSNHRLIGVGVDLVEIERAERFLMSHPGGVARFLSPAENRLLRGARNRTLAFALLFAVKEAASKAAGVTLAGPGMFRQFPVARQGHRLSVRWTGSRTRRVTFRTIPFLWQNLAGSLVYGYSS